MGHFLKFVQILSTGRAGLVAMGPAAASGSQPHPAAASAAASRPAEMQPKPPDASKAAADESKTAEQLLPDVPLGTFPLSDLLGRVVQSTFGDLANLAETLPSAGDVQRKRLLLDFCFSKRKLFVKLLVLLRLSPKLNDILTCHRVHALVDNQDFTFSRAADELYAIHNQMRIAKIACFDIPTAVDVLTTGKYQRLPPSLKKRLAAPPKLTSEEANSTIERLQDMIQVRLMCDEVLPMPFRRSMHIENGCVHFSINGEFSVALTIIPDAKPHPWRVVDVRILSSAAERGGIEDVALANAYKVQPDQLIALKESSQQIIMETEPSGWPIMRLYNHLHKMALAYQILVLSTQAAFLAECRWQRLLRTEASDGLLKLEFWLEGRHRERYTLQISVDEASAYPPLRILSDESQNSLESNFIQPSVLSSLAETVAVPASSPGLVVKLYGTLDAQFHEIPLPEHIRLDPQALNVEALLLATTDFLCLRIIRQIRDEILSIDSQNSFSINTRSTLFSPEHVVLQHTSEVVGIGRIRPTPSLLVKYRPSSWVQLSVDSRTGLVIVQLSSDIPSSSKPTQSSDLRKEESDLTAFAAMESLMPLASVTFGSTRTYGESGGVVSASADTDPIVRDLQIVEMRINNDIRNARQAILYLRRATTIKQVESVASYLGFEAVDFAHMGLESPLRHLQSDDVRLLHLRFPGEDNNFLVVAAGTHKDLVGLDDPTRNVSASKEIISTVSDRKSSENDAEEVEFRVWMLSPTSDLQQGKQVTFASSVISPDDVGISSTRNQKTVNDTKSTSSPSKRLHQPDSNLIWTKMGFDVLSSILGASRSVLALTRLVGQLESRRIPFWYLLRGVPGLVSRTQARMSKSQLLRMDPKVVVPLHELLDPDIPTSFQSSQGGSGSSSLSVDPNALDPRSGPSNPHGLGDIYLYLEEQTTTTTSTDVDGDSVMHDTTQNVSKKQVSTVPAFSHAVVAKMRIHKLLLPTKIKTQQSIGNHIEFDPKTHVVCFRYPSVEGFGHHFVSEFRAIGNMFRLVSQLTRHKKSLYRIGAVVMFPDLKSVQVAWRGSTILRVRWESQKEVVLPTGAIQSRGCYSVSFSHPDGHMDEHTVLTGLASAMLNRTGSIFHLILILNRVSRMVSSLERIRQRRHVLGQTRIELMVLSLTHCRLVFPFMGKNRGIDFVFSDPNSFMMFDAAMPPLADELGIGHGIVSADVYGPSSAATPPGSVLNAGEYSLLPEFADTFASGGSQKQAQLPRDGLVSVVCQRTVGDDASVPVSDDHGNTDQAVKHSEPSDLSATDADELEEGAIVPLPHGVLCNLSLVDAFMSAIEGYLDVMCAMNDAYNNFTSNPEIRNVLFEESSCKLSFTTHALEASVSCQANGRWKFSLVPKDDASASVHHVMAPDGVAITIPPIAVGDAEGLANKFVRDVNSTPVEIRNSFGWLVALSELAVLPNLPMSELVTLLRTDGRRPSVNGAFFSIEWHLHAPEFGSPEYAGPPGTVVFHHDVRRRRMQLYVRFVREESGESKIIPIRYNYDSGFITIWRKPGVADPTLLERGQPEFNSMIAKMSSNISAATLIERVFVQASVREIPPAIGGPGKLIAALKHLCTKTIHDLTFADSFLNSD